MAGDDLSDAAQGRREEGLAFYASAKEQLRSAALVRTAARTPPGVASARRLAAAAPRATRRSGRSGRLMDASH